MYDKQNVINIYVYFEFLIKHFKTLPKRNQITKNYFNKSYYCSNVSLKKSLFCVYCMLKVKIVVIIIYYATIRMKLYNKIVFVINNMFLIFKL